MTHKGEIVANLLMLLWIGFLYRNALINWTLGILNSLFYVYLFVPIGLYADAALQVFEIGLCIYGWNHWKSGGRKNKQLPTSYATWMVRIKALLIGVVLYAFQYYILKTYTNSDVVELDSALTAISVMAIYLMSRRHVDNWYLWLISYFGYFELYWRKHFYITAFTQVILLVISLLGWMFWSNEIEDLKLMAWSDQPTATD